MTKVAAIALGFFVLTSACTHSMEVDSFPPGASVYVGADPEPVGKTPVTIKDPSLPVRVVGDEGSVEFTITRETDLVYTLANGLLGCVGGALVIGCTAAGIYLVGLGLASVMPVLLPVVTLCGGPPAAVGTMFWSTVGGLVCGGLSLPFAACSLGSIGPDSVLVDVKKGAVTSTPSGRAQLVVPPPPLPGAPDSIEHVRY